MPEISQDVLLRWAAAATLADSYMSLVYHRNGIKNWDTVATPRSDEWQQAMGKAREAAREMSAMLADLGIDGHAIAREMCRSPWERV